MIWVAVGVKRRIRRSWSMNTVPMPVPASRLFMSLLVRDKSATLVCSSALTVVISSLIDCSSSLEVSSSSLVDCSSSLTDCISSLDDLSSSLEVSSSSLAACRCSSLARSSSVSSAIWALVSAALPAAVFTGLPASGAGRVGAAGASSSITMYSGDSSDSAGSGMSPRPPRPTGPTVRLTSVKWPLVLTRRPSRRTRFRLLATLCRAVVNSRLSPSRAIFRMLLMPASPGAGSRYMPVRPCRYKMSPRPLTSAATGATCCNSVCSVSSRSDIFMPVPPLPEPARYAALARQSPALAAPTPVWGLSGVCARKRPSAARRAS